MTQISSRNNKHPHCSHSDAQVQLQQAQRDQQTQPPWSVGAGQTAPGSQPPRVHPPRRLPRPHFFEAAAARGQPASAAAPSDLCHFHNAWPLPLLHLEAPLLVRQ